jgi:inorganic pyrophosphatase
MVSISAGPQHLDIKNLTISRNLKNLSYFCCMTQLTFQKLGPYNKRGELNVVIETPKGHRNKYKYEEEYGTFKLAGLLPAGAVFPYDFGFVPETLGGDNDPLDVLVLMDEPAFPGCIIPSRLIGVIEAEQTERNGQKTRNDRLIAVAMKSEVYHDILDIGSLNRTLTKQIEHFFISYNVVKGKEFKVLGCHGIGVAEQTLKQALDRHKKKVSS